MCLLLDVRTIRGGRSYLFFQTTALGDKLVAYIFKKEEYEGMGSAYGRLVRDLSNPYEIDNVKDKVRAVLEKITPRQTRWINKNRLC